MRDALRRYLRKHRTQLQVSGLIVLFVFVLLSPRIFVVIGSGEAGVLYRPLDNGTVVDHVYGEGLWILGPWNTMAIYSVRIQETKRTLDVLTRDGMTVTLDLSIRFRPEAGMLGVLHTTVGPQYVEKIVVPEVFSAVRQQIGNRTADELYTGRLVPDIAIDSIANTTTLIGPIPRLTSPLPPLLSSDDAPNPALPLPRVPRISAAELPNPDPQRNVTLAEIVARAAQTVSRRYVVVDAVVLMKAKLPKIVDEAVQSKMEQKQRAEAQLFRIQYAQRDVLLRQFEAQGNAELSRSLTPTLLRWKGIEASKELAASPNSKVIMIGNGAGNLPIILGAGEKP